MDLLEELIGVLGALDAAQVPYALCGGMAVAFYGYARFTKDIDLLIQAGDIERAKAVLGKIGFDLPAGPIPFEAGTPRSRVLHRVSKAGGLDLVTLDLMEVTPIFEDVFDDREIVEWKDLDLQIVSLRGLGKMKRLAGRGQDLIDLAELGLNEQEQEET